MSWIFTEQLICRPIHSIVVDLCNFIEHMTCNKFIHCLQIKHKKRIRGKYDDDTHPELHEDAYMYAAGEVNKHICNGLSSQCGSFRGSWSSQSTDRGLIPHDGTTQTFNPNLI